MATNLALDNNLIIQAQKIGGFKTKKDTVNYVLEDYIKKSKQKEILSLFGKIDIDYSYDFKQYRNRK